MRATSGRGSLRSRCRERNHYLARRSIRGEWPLRRRCHDARDPIETQSGRGAIERKLIDQLPIHFVDLPRSGCRKVIAIRGHPERQPHLQAPGHKGIWLVRVKTPFDVLIDDD